MRLPIKPGTARRMGIERPEELEPPVVLTSLAQSMVFIRTALLDYQSSIQKMAGINVDREYWDCWGHLSTCPVRGDDQMIERCTCGQADLPCRRPGPECAGKKGTQRCGSCSVRWLRPST